jgi:shikimate kinase
MDKVKRIALTGFMGVGKTSVARHLAQMLRCERLDLDSLIEEREQRNIADIINADGEATYRKIETENLRRALQMKRVRILSLGGGTWTVAENRELIKQIGMMSVWLESSFEHCWNNIRFSRKERPLARNKSQAHSLFQARQELYCLADWHFIVRPDRSSYEVASQIVEEVFG